ncbi:Rid family detoxifying hydrolase [Haloarcula sp. JP-L23]|uniref:Rid family detoxifying hydrolase n=1 Tax=Haloarcula sp. JP-L23 TaxID=2716717 RepID=UPI00140EDC7A|nr:RidA family protein [Haloarcula sp. JP-L23]
MKQIISTDDAPAAIGAYSQATTDGSLILTSGQLPLTREGELLDDASIEDQTKQCLDNIQAILQAEGASMSSVLKTTVFLDNINTFEEFNQSYSDYFDENPPARSAIEVGEVPKGAALEIEAIAVAEQ